jgi:multiple sugar transport system permease protein
MSAHAVAAPSSPDQRRADRRRSVHPLGGALGRHPIGWVFIAPYVVFLVAIFAYPLISALWMSFHDAFFAAPGVSVPQPWVGLGNYREVLADPQVQRAFVNIGEFLVINVPLTAILALVLATALNSKLPARGFFRSAYYVPYITASVAVVTVWLFLFSGGGLVDRVLGPLAPNPSWLVNTGWAMPMIALYVTWKQLGFFILLYLAALQGVPKERYESAAVDGATQLQRFRNVTIPSVRSATSLVVVLAIITGGTLFTEPYLLTSGGGPVNSSTSPVLIIYQRGIEQGRPGFASALGVILIIIVLAISLLSRRLVGRDDQ